MYDEEFVRKSFLDEIKSLSRRADAEGVTAYLHRPRTRHRPNERFLKTTLQGIEFTNRRLDEEEMWRIHRRQQEQKPSEADECSKGVVSGRKCVDLSTANAEGSERLQGQPLHMSIKRARGRGSIGPRSDLEGGQHKYSYDETCYREPDDVDGTMKFESKDNRIDEDTKSRSSHKNRHKKRRRDKKTGEGEQKHRSSRRSSRKKTDSYD